MTQEKLQVYSIRLNQSFSFGNCVQIGSFENEITELVENEIARIIEFENEITRVIEFENEITRIIELFSPTSSLRYLKLGGDSHDTSLNETDFTKLNHRITLEIGW